MTTSFSDQSGIKSLGNILLSYKIIDTESIITNSVGSRNQKNDNPNLAIKSKYALQLNDSVSSKWDGIFSVLHPNIQGLETDS